MGSEAAEEDCMVPKFVSDAGYTAVGLGVLAAQQVQVRRREARARLEAHAEDVRRRAESVVEQAKTAMTPVAAQLERLPRLPIPGPLGHALEGSRGRLCQMLRES